MGVAIGAAAIIAMVLISYKAYFQAKRVAKLLHEKDLAEEKKCRLVVDGVLEENEEKVDKYNAKIVHLDEKLKTLDHVLIATEKKWQIEKEKVNALENWKDIDNYLRSLPRADTSNSNGGSNGGNGVSI